MFTHCLIGFLDLKNNSLGGRCIYCECDGYPQYTGTVLTYYYNTKEKIEELLKLGDISLLGEMLAPPKGCDHSYDYPMPHVTLAYCRDRDMLKYKKGQARPRKSGAKFYSLTNKKENFVHQAFVKFAYLYDCNTNEWLTYEADVNLKTGVRFFQLIYPPYKKYLEKAVENGFMTNPNF